MFIKKFYIDNEQLVIKLELEHYTGKAIIDMSYLREEGMRQTITTAELNEDLDLLIPDEVGEDFFGENPITPIMLTQLKKAIDVHIKKYGRLLQSDLGTYVAECIVIIDAYTNQILKTSFEAEKKETFQTLFNFYYNQLPEKWKI